MRIAAAAAPTTSTRDSDANFMGLLYGGGRPDSALALGDERCDLAALLFAGNFQVRLGCPSSPVYERACLDVGQAGFLHEVGNSVELDAVQRGRELLKRDRGGL